MKWQKFVVNKRNRMGSQIRSYVFHPYSMVKIIVQMKKLLTKVDAVMDGNIAPFIEAYLRQTMSQND